MTELYDTTYPPKAAIIDGLLYAETYLFVGAPKIGKSFFMAQLSYHVATGATNTTIPLPHPPRFAEDPALLLGCRANGRSVLIDRFAAVWATVRQRLCFKAIFYWKPAAIVIKYLHVIVVLCLCLSKGFIKFFVVLGIAKQDALKSLRHHFRGRSTRLRAAMCDKWAIAALPKNGSNPSVVRRTIW